MNIRNETATPINPLLAQRWSPRGYDENYRITDEDLHRLFEAVRWTPSANNLQPWAFVAAHQGSENFEAIYNCLIGFNKSWAGRSSLLIVGFAKVSQYGKPLTWAQFDLGQACAHLSFEAETIGLNVHQMGGFDGEELSRNFGVSDEYLPLVVIAVGRYSNSEELPDIIRELDESPRKRKSFNELFLKPVQ